LAEFKPVRESAAPNLESTKNSLQVSYNLDSEGGNVEYNLIVKTFLPKRPTFQIEASGIESHNKIEGAPYAGLTEQFSPPLQEIPIVALLRHSSRLR
jgi:hypothetical protein